MSTTATIERWERWVGRVPFGALAVATAAAMAAGPQLGVTTPTARLVAQITLVGAVAVWMWWCEKARASTWQERPWSIVYYVVRTVLALVLTLLNPLFCIFAWVGFVDAHSIFHGRARWVALGASAMIVASGQAGGIPMRLDGQLALFAVLLVVNFGLASVFSSYGNSMAVSNEERAGAISELEHLNAELEAALAENQRLEETVVAQARQAGIQEERQRLAREIHDTIAQSLAGIVAQLQAAERSPADTSQRLERAERLAREALTEARRSVMGLAPATLTDSTLAAAISALVTSWAKDRDVRAEAVLVGEPRVLHPEVEAAVLRIAQEALANVARHAHADRVGVTLTFDEDEVVLDVRDDGTGFDPTRPAGSTSFGLRGMRQRTAQLAGSLEVEASPGTGTAICARFPALARSVA